MKTSMLRTCTVTTLCAGLVCVPSLAVAAMSVKTGPKDIQAEQSPSGGHRSRPSAAAKAQDGDEPLQEMLIGFHVNSIDDIDWNNGTFRADLYWWVLYPQPSNWEETQNIESLEFINGEIIEERRNRLQERKRVGTQVYASYRTIARFHFNSDFRNYPFDRQRFPIVIEHEVMPVTRFVLKDDVASYKRSQSNSKFQGLGKSVHIPDLQVIGVRREFSAYEYNTDFGDPTAPLATGFSRVVLAIEVQRQFAPFLIKMVVPLVIILLLAYLVFFVPAQELDVAVGLTVTSVLACIAVQYTLDSEIPDVGYLIASDRIFHLCYFLIMLAMAETVLTFNLAKRGRGALSRTLERYARGVFPLAFVCGMALIILDALYY